MITTTTVFCDFDGPIMDVSDRYYEVYRFAILSVSALYQTQGNTLPVQMLSKEQFWQMKQEHIPDCEIARQSGLCQEQEYIFFQKVRQIVNKPALLQHDQLQAGTQSALSLLCSQGFRLVLVTLRHQDQVAQILQHNGLACLFSRIYGTQDDHAAYSNHIELKTQLLTKALAEHYNPGRQTDSAWMIGDTEADILAGQSLGISTIALTCGIRSHSYLEKLKPTQIHSNLLTAAKYLLEPKQQLVA